MSVHHLLRRVLAAVLPAEHRAVMRADFELEPSIWQLVASLPGVSRLRLRSLRAGVWEDIRHGVRLLKRQPGFAAAATFTLLLGVAATNAVGTVAHAVLVRPLPFPDADRIVSVTEIDRTGAATGPNLSWQDFLAYQSRTTALELMAGHNGGSRTVEIDGREAERVPVAAVTGTFFDLLGVQPLFGRTLNAADMVEGSPLVVVLSHASWRTRFHADPDVIGRVITLNGGRVSIAGVLPSTFEFPPRGLAELWIPLRPNPAQRDRRFFHWMTVIGRVRPGVGLGQAEADLDGIARTFAAEDPRAHATTGVRVVSLRERLVGDTRPMLLVLLSAGLLLLTVASANVAGLLLSRGVARRAEMGLRGALGAARGRLVRQLVVENVVLAIPGTLGGLALGFAATRAFVAAIPQSTRVSLPHLSNLRLDPGAIAITVAIVLAVVTLCGLIPALRTARDARLGGRGVVGRSGRAQWVLAGGQVALAVTLLSGAGLMVQSMRRLLDVSPGFRTDGLLTFTLSLSGPRYQTPDAVTQLFDTVTDDLTSLPGVEGVSRIDLLPLTGPGNSGSFTTVGEEDRGALDVLVRSVAANYFDVMGIDLLEGRAFSNTDVPASPRVVLVNRQLARSHFNDAPLGRRITFPFTGPEPFTVVGVVGDEQFDAVDQPIAPVVYFASRQSPSGAQSFVLRTSGQPAAMLPLIRARVAALDAHLPVFGATTMDTIADASPAIFRRRAVMTLLLAFAAAAVVLAAIGIYGVLAQAVADRTREIGVRLALGAGATGVITTVVGRGLLWTTAGLAAGIAFSALLGRAMSALLFSTVPSDGWTMVIVVGMTIGLVTIAALPPTRRALSIDPMDALRGD